MKLSFYCACGFALQTWGKHPAEKLVEWKDLHLKDADPAIHYETTGVKAAAARRRAWKEEALSTVGDELAWPPASADAGVVATSQERVTARSQAGGGEEPDKGVVEPRKLGLDDGQGAQRVTPPKLRSLPDPRWPD